MKKTLTIILLLVFIVVLKSFFMTRASSLEKFNDERDSEINILGTTNTKRSVSAEHNSSEITLHTQIEIEIELELFWPGKNSDIIIIRLLAETEGLVLTYYNDITLEEGPVGILEAEYLNAKEQTPQSARLAHGVDSKITGIVIKIEFHDGDYFIEFGTCIKYESGTFEVNKEELKIKAEDTGADPAKLSFELVSTEALGWNSEVKIVSTVLQAILEPPPGEEELPEPSATDSGKKDSSEGAEMKFPETGGSETMYSIIIAAGGAILLTATAGLIIKNKRRNV